MSLDLDAVKARAESGDTTLNDAFDLIAEVERLRDKIEDRRMRLVEAEDDLLNIRGLLSGRAGLPIGKTAAPVVAHVIEQWDKALDEIADLRARLAGYEPERVDAVPGRPLPAGVEGHDPHQWTGR